MKRSPDIHLTLAPRPDGITRHRWLYTSIQRAIIGGQLAPGERLPASRDLARLQDVSRSTVVKVFDQLLAEGYIDSTVGKGSFVSSRLPETPVQATAAAARKPTLSARGQLLARSPFPTAARALPLRAFRPNQPDLQAFPFQTWNRIYSRSSRSAKRHLLANGDIFGFLPLRDAIAAHLRHARGIACRGEHVVIVNSVQQGLDILARLVLDPGDAAWVEHPGYPGAQMVLEAAGARIAAVPVDEDGLDVAAGRLLAPHARLAYVTAARQSPLGMPLALERRLALLQWASESGALIVEDDYDSEFRFAGAPLAALKSLDSEGSVVYAGNMNKTLFASLRLSYLVLPDSLVTPFTQALSLTSRYLAPQQQVVLHEFIAEGHYARHLRRMRLLYAERADALSHAMARHMAGRLQLPPIVMGLDVPAFLAYGSDETAFCRLAEAAGVETRPLSFYGSAPGMRPGLLLGFAAFTPAEIDAGAATLAQVFDGWQENR